MGIRGLQTFLEQYCPSACYSVSIEKLANEYRRETGQEPELVVDAQSCYNPWCRGLDWTLGFEMQEFLGRLRAFVEAFKKIGVKLVFFFGGPTVEKKRDAWIERRLRNVRDVMAVFDFLAKGNMTKNIPDRLESLPPTIGLTTSFLLKYVLECEVYMSVKECDEEIAEYAHGHNSFGIFGQDSDFVIFDVKAWVLSSKNFDIRTMSTLVYDKVKLAQCLDIRVDQLPFLAVVGGNDIIHFEDLKGFHSRLCNTSFERMIHYNVLFPLLARYVKELPDAPLDEIFEIISGDIFDDDSNTELIRLSYEGYIIRPQPIIPAPTDKWLRILRIASYRHRNLIVPSAILSVMENQVFEFSVSFEDFRRVSDKNRIKAMLPSATISRLMRQKLYGILLFEYERTPVIVKEWCGENMDSYKEPVETPAIMPAILHPGLLTLWSDNNSDRVEKIKWRLFLNSVSESITRIEDWCILTEDLLLPTCTLYYLLEHGFMNVHELHALIATIVTSRQYSRGDLRNMYYGTSHPRATHLSVTFTRTYSIVLTLFAACGYPVPLTADLVYLQFEAKLFQIKFKDMKQRKTIKELCENDVKCLIQFYDMRKLILKSPQPTQRLREIVQ